MIRCRRVSGASTNTNKAREVLTSSSLDVFSCASKVVHFSDAEKLREKEKEL